MWQSYFWQVFEPKLVRISSGGVCGIVQRNVWDLYGSGTIYIWLHDSCGRNQMIWQVGVIPMRYLNLDYSVQMGGWQTGSRGSSLRFLPVFTCHLPLWHPSVHTTNIVNNLIYVSLKPFWIWVFLIFETDHGEMVCNLKWCGTILNIYGVWADMHLFCFRFDR